MSETMREKTKRAEWDVAIAVLAEGHDEMSLRLAALERAEVERNAVKVAPTTDATPAPGLTGCPFCANAASRIAEMEDEAGRLRMAVNSAGRRGDELLKQRREVQATADALEAERDALASQLATMAAEAIALRGERDAAVFRANDAEARWRTARESLDIHISERLATMAAERDAAVAKERADVVAWLRSRDFDHVDVSNYTKHRAIEEVMCDVTTQIERAEHAGASEK